MATYLDLKKAIAKDEENIGFKDDDIYLVDKNMDKFKAYFDAIYKQQQLEDNLLILFDKGYISEEEGLMHSEKADSQVKIAYDSMRDGARTLNNMARIYGLSAIAPKENATEKEFISFVAKYVSEVYQNGVGEDNISIDTVFARQSAELDNEEFDEEFDEDSLEDFEI